MIRSRHFCLTLLALLPCSLAHGQGVRSHTRMSGTSVTEAQAADLTLTLSQVSVRPIQVWVRGAAGLDGSGKILTASFDPREARFVKVGQRVRAFTPESKSYMQQAYVTRMQSQGDRVSVDMTLAGVGKKDARYVIEIVAEAGDFLSVPNEAIIEEGDKHIIYLQQSPGQYVPTQVEIGVQGELYTQVIAGLKANDQVVTFGSFFVDSEYKLKGPVAADVPNH